MKEDARMSADIPRIRILTVDDHPVRTARYRRSAWRSARYGFGRGSVQRPRGDSSNSCAQRPDVTLMDLQMPEMNGIDAVTAIRSEFPDAKIIVLTTYVGDVQILAASQSRCPCLSDQEYFT
jgi:DNA-binding NarL/FixJ family response regulator